MTDDQIIELMARAIHDADDASDTVWPEHENDDGHRGGDGYVRLCRWPEVFRAQASAALFSLRSAGMAVVPREPTDDMLSAGISERHSQPPAVKIAWSMATANIYRAMINTAEGKTE